MGVLPLSAVLATEEIYSSFLGAGDRTFFHGHSYTANPLYAVAALANLELMDERATVDHAAWIGRTLGDLLKPLDDDERVVEVRRIGTMTGIEVKPTGIAPGCGSAPPCATWGVITRPLGDVVILMPPLGIAEPELQQMASASTTAWTRSTAPRRELARAARRAATCRGLHHTLRPRESGRVDIASNDYLGLARDHDVIEAGVTALRRWGPARPDPGWSAATPPCTRNWNRHCPTWWTPNAPSSSRRATWPTSRPSPP